MIVPEGGTEPARGRIPPSVDFHGTPWTPRGLAPELGEPTDDVLGSLGH